MLYAVLMLITEFNKYEVFKNSNLIIFIATLELIKSIEKIVEFWCTHSPPSASLINSSFVIQHHSLISDINITHKTF